MRRGEERSAVHIGSNETIVWTNNLLAIVLASRLNAQDTNGQKQGQRKTDSRRSICS